MSSEDKSFFSESSHPHTTASSWTSSQGWAFPVFSWLLNKERLQTTVAAPQTHYDASVCSHSKSKEDVGDDKELEDDGGQLPESKALPCQFLHHRNENSKDVTFQHPAALNICAAAQKDPVHDAKTPSASGHAPPQEPAVSRVPLRLQIKVSGQRGSLGLSIAGGKGSLPYKNHDEGIFISRVVQGGASEKAGIQVGDRLLEVNGLNVQGATHQEAVSALRNAGSCIKMTVLRDRASDPGGLQDQRDAVERQLCRPAAESAEEPPSGKIDANFCNGNGLLLGFGSEPKRPFSDVKVGDFVLREKQTMAIPRIILTHPSTSDEDVELLTQSPSTEPSNAFDTPDRCVCFDSAFFAP